VAAGRPVADFEDFLYGFHIGFKFQSFKVQSSKFKVQSSKFKVQSSKFKESAKVHNYSNQ
jgi:hypothetical protein